MSLTHGQEPQRGNLAIWLPEARTIVLTVVVRAVQWIKGIVDCAASTCTVYHILERDKGPIRISNANPEQVIVTLLAKGSKSPNFDGEVRQRHPFRRSETYSLTLRMGQRVT